MQMKKGGMTECGESTCRSASFPSPWQHTRPSVNRKDSLVWLLLPEADRGQLAALLGSWIAAEWVRWSRGLPSWQQEVEHRREGRASEGGEVRRERRFSFHLGTQPTDSATHIWGYFVKRLWKHHRRYTEGYVTNIFEFSPSSKVGKVNKGHPLMQ